MSNKFGRWRPIFEILGISIVFGALHVLFFRLLQVDTRIFVYSNLELYAYFLVASILILAVLIIAQRKNQDYVGYTFLIATSAKMVGAYILLRPVLEQNIKAEKINFFVVFALFLAFETVTASRMLNRQ
ncbi:MAG: hypothetical protein EOO50_03415 [Flavobacterium sp.]|uniref:hypothetical protein n=1 Tax=Flavobacterium sp. TaxID=239 RepID=UPI0011FB5DF0|nr:hypothetical protein [Flavobacterium sp.]RZJ67883.1 MAG: hypothetical protein EOO50_03415 [Flavobacterium sp.]